MKKIKREEQKVKPLMKLEDDFLDLRNLDTNIIIKQIEENIKLRGMSISDQLKKKFHTSQQQQKISDQTYEQLPKRSGLNRKTP